MLPDNYYDKMALGYRDVWTETWDILERDWHKITSTMQTRGLWFMLAVVVLMSISLAKVVINVISCHKFKKYWSIKFEPTEISAYESQGSQEAKMFVNETLQPQKHPTSRSTSAVTSLQTVRNYLLQNDMTLNARIFKGIRHNVSDDIVSRYVRTGEIIKPFITEYLDFGEIQKPLIDVLKNKIPSRKCGDYSYLLTYNGEMEAIENELKKIFLNDNIKIKIDNLKEYWYN